MKNLSTGETLNEPQKLPENWGPIFGLHGFLDKIGNLSWLGDAYANVGWVEVGESTPEPTMSTLEELEWNKAKQMLKDSDWTMLPDVPMTNATKTAWIEYRKALREIKLQTGFPNNINWPSIPE